MRIVISAMIPKYAQIAYTAIMTPSGDISMSPSFISFLVEHSIYTIPSIVSKGFSNFFLGGGFCMTIQIKGFCMTIQIKRVLYDNTSFV